MPLLVLPNATTTALVSDAPNGAQEGTRITFTATVTESGSPVTEGLVQFSVDGKTQGLPIQVNSNGVAIDTNNSLTSGSHTIQAVYLGTDKFVGEFSQPDPEYLRSPDFDHCFQRQQPECGGKHELRESVGGYRQGRSW